MSYLDAALVRLEELMHEHGLSEDVQDSIGTFFREKVLESFKNGVEKGSKQAGDTRREAPRSDKPAPRKAWRPARRR